LLIKRKESDKYHETHYIVRNNTEIGIKLISYFAIAINQKWNLNEPDLYQLRREIILKICEIQGRYYHTRDVAKRFYELEITYIKK